LDEHISGIPGKVQEEELDSCRAADVRRYVTPSQNRWRH